MNIIKLMGGIGNQMFQYAFGKAQWQMQNTNILIVYDKSFYDKAKATDQYPRLYHLDKFMTGVNVASLQRGWPTIREQRVGFDMTLLTRDHANFEGYWQYYPYIKPVLPLLRKEFVLQEKYYTTKFLSLQEVVSGCDSIAVHVRRGDYLTHKGVFRDLKFDYYMRALAEFKDGDTVFIFSDDLPWCRVKFKPDYSKRKFVFVDLNEYLSFELMRLCNHHIIANSTFSYWAAILKDDPNQVVVCPSEWLVNKIQDDGKEIFFPKHWLKIQGNAV